MPPLPVGRFLVLANMKTPEQLPTTHLTRQRAGWTLIHQGMPLCADGSTLSDCLAIAARARLHLPAQVWIAGLGRFGSLQEARVS